MKKKKKIIFYLSSFIITSSVFTLKLNKETSNELANKTLEYTSNFTNDDFLVVAHRGFSSIEIENTQSSLTLAAAKDYIDYIEIDIRLTNDNEIVISHNNKINTNPLNQIKINESDYNTIYNNDFIYNSLPNELLKQTKLDEKKIILKRTINKFNKNYQIINFQEGIKYCGNKNIIIDIKFSNNYIEFSNKLIEELKSIDNKNIYLQSANLLGIYYLQENTDYNCFAIFDKKEDLQYQELFDNICIKKDLVEKNYIDNLLKNNKQVAIWTINTSNDLKLITDELESSYKNIMYITDYPDVIVTELHYLDEEKTKSKNFKISYKK